jgi:hypothetical protein
MIDGFLLVTELTERIPIPVTLKQIVFGSNGIMPD